MSIGTHSIAQISCHAILAICFAMAHLQNDDQVSVDCQEFVSSEFDLLSFH